MKTISLKKVSAVAVASLGFGLLSVAPANANPTAATVTSVVGLTTGGTTTAATANQATGNQVTFRITPTGTGTLYMNYTGVGSIQTATDRNDVAAGVAADANADSAMTALNGVNYTDGASTAVGTTLQVIDVTLTSPAVGTQTVKVQVVDAATGLYSSLATLTVTWIAAASEAGIDASQSTIYLVEDGDTCVFGSNKSGDVNAAAANAETVTSVPAGTVVDVCFMGRNKSGTRLAAATATVAISSAGATQDTEAAVGGTGGYVSEQTAGAPTNYIGTATYTVIFVDALGGAATLSTTLTYWGDIASISIANPAVAGGYAAAKGGANNAGANLDSASVLAALTSSSLPGTSTSGLGYIAVTAKDKGGNVINLARGTTNDIGAVTIDSTFTAGAPSAGSSDSAGATLTLSTNDADLSPAAFGTNIYVVDCSASSKAEKLSVTIVGVTSAGALLPSNTVTFYCSDAVDKVTVTGTTSTVNVDLLDANGYPVADGTSVSLVASNGAVVAPATLTTVNGKFANAATFIPSSTSSTATVTAIVGSKSGTSAAIAGTGTASTQSIATSIASLNAKIVALNALIAKIMKRLNIR